MTEKELDEFKRLMGAFKTKEQVEYFKKRLKEDFAKLEKEQKDKLNKEAEKILNSSMDQDQAEAHIFNASFETDFSNDVYDEF